MKQQRDICPLKNRPTSYVCLVTVNSKANGIDSSKPSFLPRSNLSPSHYPCVYPSLSSFALLYLYVVIFRLSLPFPFQQHCSKCKCNSYSSLCSTLGDIPRANLTRISWYCNFHFLIFIP